MKYIIGFFIFISILIFNISTSYAIWPIYHKSDFKGKVIDAETKEPIEGAVVVVVYNKITYAIIEKGTDAIKAKETLTDKNGEFNFPSYTTLIAPLSGEHYASFLIYKPGYKDSVEFTVWALPEGLVYPTYKFSAILKKRVDDNWRQKFEEYLKTIPEKDRERKHRLDATNYIQLYRAVLPMKNSKERLQNLDIPFFQIPDDVDVESIKWDYRFDSDYEIDEESNYKLLGLKKTKTKEERLRAMPSSPTDFRSKELPLLYKAINDERRRFGIEGEEK